MEVDENKRQTLLQFDPSPNQGNESTKESDKRTPDYFL
jgi:hypothetical protein